MAKLSIEVMILLAVGAAILWVGIRGLATGKFDFRHKLGGMLLTPDATPGKYWVSVVFHLTAGPMLVVYALFFR